MVGVFQALNAEINIAAAAGEKPRFAGRYGARIKDACRVVENATKAGIAVDGPAQIGRAGPASEQGRHDESCEYTKAHSDTAGSNAGLRRGFLLFTLKGRRGSVQNGFSPRVPSSGIILEAREESHDRFAGKSSTQGGNGRGRDRKKAPMTFNEKTPPSPPAGFSSCSALIESGSSLLRLNRYKDFHELVRSILNSWGRLWLFSLSRHPPQ